MAAPRAGVPRRTAYWWVNSWAVPKCGLCHRLTRQISNSRGEACQPQSAQAAQPAPCDLAGVGVFAGFLGTCGPHIRPGRELGQRPGCVGSLVLSDCSHVQGGGSPAHACTHMHTHHTDVHADATRSPTGVPTSRCLLTGHMCPSTVQGAGAGGEVPGAERTVPPAVAGPAQVPAARGSR